MDANFRTLRKSGSATGLWLEFLVACLPGTGISAAFRVVYAALQGVLAGLLAVTLWNYSG
jgi:hypothetical protein